MDSTMNVKIEKHEMETYLNHALKSPSKIHECPKVQDKRRTEWPMSRARHSSTSGPSKDQRTCSISTFFLSPLWLSSDARVQNGAWLDNCVHWCHAIDNVWKIYRTGCGHGSTAGDLTDCFCIVRSINISDRRFTNFEWPSKLATIDKVYGSYEVRVIIV